LSGVSESSGSYSLSITLRAARSRWMKPSIARCSMPSHTCSTPHRHCSKFQALHHPQESNHNNYVLSIIAGLHPPPESNHDGTASTITPIITGLHLLQVLRLEVMLKRYVLGLEVMFSGMYTCHSDAPPIGHDRTTIVWHPPQGQLHLGMRHAEIHIAT
jgi:hypothetical protein